MNKLSSFGWLSKVGSATFYLGVWGRHIYLFNIFQRLHSHFSFALFFFSPLFSTFLESDQITHMTNDVFHSVSYADSYLLW